MAGGTGCSPLRRPLGEEEKPWQVREVSNEKAKVWRCAGSRLRGRDSRDKPTAREKLSPHPAARLCASRFFGVATRLSGLADPAAERGFRSPSVS